MGLSLTDKAGTQGLAAYVWAEWQMCSDYSLTDFNRSYMICHWSCYLYNNLWTKEVAVKLVLFTRLFRLYHVAEIHKFWNSTERRLSECMHVPVSSVAIVIKVKRITEIGSLGDV